MRHYIYFEEQEGGMDETLIEKPKDLEFLNGWLDRDCFEDDVNLLKWMHNDARVGTYYRHRLGFLVRLEDT